MLFQFRFGLALGPNVLILFSLNAEYCTLKDGLPKCFSGSTFGNVCADVVEVEDLTYLEIAIQVRVLIQT